MDNSPRQAVESAAFTQCQDDSRLQPPRHWSPPLPSWHGLERSTVTHHLPAYPYLSLIYWLRTRTKLTSGDLAVRGDQWPLLLYAEQKFDPEEPWDGLLRSELLIWVRTTPFSFWIIHYVIYRPSSTSSLRPVPWRKRSRQRDQATLVSMA